MWISKKVAKMILGLVSGVFVLFVFVFFGVKFGWTNVRGVIDRAELKIEPAPDWSRSEEWQILQAALLKDGAEIKQAAAEAEISPRLVVAMVVPEQLRLFTDEREIFKQIFAPLKILGNQTQFSWGVAGLKPETAAQIEQNLLDENSAFYPGQKYEHLLDFTSDNRETERFARITNEDDHYFSYLYTALYLKEISAQWQRAGFNISEKPAILATLFNIGFANSQPKRNPLPGGAVITIGGRNYSFGRLAHEFYYSRELREIFP